MNIFGILVHFSLNTVFKIAFFCYFCRKVVKNYRTYGHQKSRIPDEQHSV